MSLDDINGLRFYAAGFLCVAGRGSGRKIPWHKQCNVSTSALSEVKAIKRLSIYRLRA